MNKYHFQEGIINVPENMGDGTVNLIVPLSGNSGLTIAITRDARVGTENLIDFIERQMKDLSRQVPKFTQGKLESAVLGQGQAAYRGYKFDVSYRQNARTVYHVQSIFGDEVTPKTMGFSFSSHVPITDEQRSLIVQILDSYVPHRS